MTSELPYPWSPLTDLDKATQWCDAIAVEKLEKMSLQALLLAVSTVLEEGQRLATEAWDSDTENVPEERSQKFITTASMCHDALIIRAAAAHRQAPDCIQPPPSRPLSIATLAARLDDVEGPAGLPPDVTSALFELECVRQMVIDECFSPLVRTKGGANSVPAMAFESLACAIGVIIACVKQDKPWALVS